MTQALTEERWRNATERGEFPVCRFECLKPELVKGVPRGASLWLDKELVNPLDEFTMSMIDAKTGSFLPASSVNFSVILRLYRTLLLTLRTFEQHYSVSFVWENLVSLNEAETVPTTEDGNDVSKVLPVAFVLYDTSYRRAFPVRSLSLPWRFPCWLCRSGHGCGTLWEGGCFFPFFRAKRVSMDSVKVPRFTRCTVEQRVVWAIAMIMVFLACLTESRVYTRSLSYYYWRTLQVCVAYLDGVDQVEQNERVVIARVG